MILYFPAIVEALYGSGLVEALLGSYCHLLVQVTTENIFVETLINPYQGLKLGIFAPGAAPRCVETLINPYQGLKQCDSFLGKNTYGYIA